jgi:pimeloyl-ACP methyl ester carboxylesterase
MVGGAGTTDRDGNNYSVPGKNDGIKALAYALRDLGVATYRYDKRGSGESYLLAGREEDQRFGDYVEDAMAAFRSLRGDKSFSRVLLLGHTEGGLVAAAAGHRLQAAGLAVDGLALLCTTGKTAVETFQSGLSEVPEEYKAEAAAIMDSLKAGKAYPSPSAYFQEFFRPSFQPYLMSWFRFDIKAELKAWKGPILLVQGNQDFQVSLAEFTILAAARPDAAAFVLPSMNHVLKDVPTDLDENYASFSDPAYPLADRLGELVAAFAKGGALPLGLPRMDGGILRNQ